jgi:hypothetical protein
LPSHEEYVVAIEYDEKVKWQVRRRYSEFDTFRKKLLAILPSSARKTLPPLPPKVLFNRRSSKVISDRREKLTYFLSSLLSQIRSEASFDGIKLSSRREEEHLLFLFLDAYKALQSYVEDNDFTSDDEASEDNDNDCDDASIDENSGSFDLSFRDRQQLLSPRGSASGRVVPLLPSSGDPRGGPLDKLLHTRNRRVSAALFSVCVLVLSLVGNVYRLKH